MRQMLIEITADDVLTQQQAERLCQSLGRALAKFGLGSIDIRFLIDPDEDFDDDDDLEQRVAKLERAMAGFILGG